MHLRISSESVVLMGAGGHAASVADVVKSTGRSVRALVDDAATNPAVDVVSRAEYDTDRELYGKPALVAIGSNAIRRNVQASLAAVSPAIIASTATTAGCKLGDGTVVHHHAHVGPRAYVGEGCIVNTGAIVEHDCRVGDFAHVGPGAVLLGGVVVEPGAFIGARAVVLPGVSVGAGATVGAGAVVTSDVPDASTVVGIPARPLK